MPIWTTEGLKLMRPTLDGARSIADVLARIETCAGETPAGGWIVTMPVGDPPFYFGGPAALAERRMPTRDELDRAAPEHPVCILPPSGYWGAPPCHMALNSHALRLNRIDATTTPSLAGIEILKDEAGEPTGVFVDHNPRESTQLDLLPEVPGFSIEERRDGVREAVRLYHSKGTTSIYEGHGCSPDVMRIYQDMWEAGALTMRVGMVVNPPCRRRSPKPRASCGTGSAMPAARGWAIRYSGSPGSTSAMAAIQRRRASRGRNPTTPDIGAISGRPITRPNSNSFARLPLDTTSGFTPSPRPEPSVTSSRF